MKLTLSSHIGAAGTASSGLSFDDVVMKKLRKLG